MARTTVQSTAACEDVVEWHAPYYTHSLVWDDVYGDWDRIGIYGKLKWKYARDPWWMIPPADYKGVSDTLLQGLFVIGVAENGTPIAWCSLTSEDEGPNATNY